jgi:RND family efflux transporter MFP subunit
VQDGVPIAGVVIAPFLGLEFTASKGKGATLNRERLPALRAVDPSRAVVATGFPFRNKARMPLAAKQAALQEANVILIKSRLELEATRLTAPVNGIVLARFVNSDERVEVNQVLLQLGDLEKVYLLAQVQDESVSRIHEGQPAEVFFSAYPTTTFKGTIEHVDPRIDPKTRAFTAYVTVHNPDLKLKPGLTGFIRVKIEKTVLAVPTVAVINPFGENASVFAIDSHGHAVLTPVRVGLEAGGMMEIVSGLKEGSLVVTAGTVNLVDNDRVHVESSMNPAQRVGKNVAWMLLEGGLGAVL